MPTASEKSLGETLLLEASKKLAEAKGVLELLPKMTDPSEREKLDVSDVVRHLDSLRTLVSDGTDGGASKVRREPANPLQHFVFDYLKDSGERASVEELLKALENDFDGTVTQGNLSVNLSRMVSDGLLIRPARGFYAVEQPDPPEVG